MGCTSTGACSLFYARLAARPAMAFLMRRRYCLGDNSKCARFLVAKSLGRFAAPDDLFPSEVERARAIIAVRVRVHAK